MINLLLDQYPTGYNGYLIRTDYRIAIQILMAIDDTDLSEMERTAMCINLLFGKGSPPLKDALAGIKWFMSGGNEREQEAATDNNPIFSFDYDNKSLFSGFLKNYGINLHTAKLHWFEFQALLGDLSDCAFSTVVDIRTRDLSGMKGKERTAWLKLKEKYALPVAFTKEEQDAIEDFWSQIDDSKIIVE